MARIRHHLDIDDLVKRYISGASELQLAKDFQVSRALIRERLLSAGVEIRDRKAAAVARVYPPLPEQVGTGTLTELKARYAAGQSVYEIAEAFGVSRYVVEYRVKALGILRTPSERVRLNMSKLTPDQRHAQSSAARLAHSEAAAERRGGGPTRREQRAADSVAGSAWRSRGISVRTVRKARDVAGWQSTMAALRYQNGTAIGAHEMTLADLIRDRGIDVEQQLPVGPYNLDIAIGEVLDIEIETARGHPLTKARGRQRRKDLINAGWTILYVWVPKPSTLDEACADYVVSYLEEIRADPTLVGKHRVIRGTGQRAATSGGQLYDWPLVPAPEGYFN